MDEQPQAPLPAQPTNPKVEPDYWKQPRPQWLKYLVALVIIIVLAIGYLFVLKPKPASKSPSQATPAASQVKAGQIESATKSYTSNNFFLTFSYPSDWTVTDNGGGIMTVKSSLLALQSAGAQTVNGYVVVTFRDKTQKLNEFDKGNATATRDSEKISYTKPTQTQRGSTYISFLQYATTGRAGALDGIYITGDSGYQKGQAIPLVDITKVDPVISITFQDKNGASMSVPDSLWDDASFSGPLKAVLQSLSIT